MQTTFEVETPSEHESEVAARTDVCTASATARAPGERGDDRAEVEVALVDPDLLDARHDLADRAPDGLRVLPVERVPGPDEDDVGAAPERLGRAHRRADPEAAGDVVRRRDDAAALRDCRRRRAAACGATGLRAPRRPRRTRRGRDGRESARAERYGAAVITAPPPPPAIEQPAPYQLSYGVVAGTAAPGTRRVIVRVGSRTLADMPLAAAALPAPRRVAANRDDRARSITVNRTRPPEQRHRPARPRRRRGAASPVLRAPRNDVLLQRTVQRLARALRQHERDLRPEPRRPEPAPPGTPARRSRPRRP